MVEALAERRRRALRILELRYWAGSSTAWCSASRASSLAQDDMMLVTVFHR